METNTFTGGYTHYMVDNNKICYVIGEGRVDFNMSIQSMNDVVLDSSFSKDMHVIVDLRKIDYHPSYKELLGIHNHLQFLSENFLGGIAVVSSEQLFYVAHFVCTLANLTKLKIKVFKEPVKARNWLNDMDSL